MMTRGKWFFENAVEKWKLSRANVYREEMKNEK